MLHKIKELAFVLSGKINYNTQSKIIFYHDVHKSKRKYTHMSTSMDVFKQHINILKNEGYTPVAKIENKTREIQINFDDGFRGIYDNKDYFVEHNLRPTIFLAINLIGKEGYMNVSEILELQDLGFIFESHAYTHENLTSFDDEALGYELSASKTYLEELLNKEITEICFPIGYFSDRVLTFCNASGYKTLYSSLPGNYYNTRKDGLVYRNLVQFSSPKEFKAILNGAMTPFFGWYKRKQYVNPDANR